MAGDGSGVGGLVIQVLVEADGEGLYGTTALRLHQSNHSAGIYSSGKEGPQRNIGNHAQADSRQQYLMQLLDDFRIRTFDLCFKTASGNISSRPELGKHRPLMGRMQRENMPGLQLVNVLID